MHTVELIATATGYFVWAAAALALLAIAFANARSGQGSRKLVNMIVGAVTVIAAPIVVAIVCIKRARQSEQPPRARGARTASLRLPASGAAACAEDPEAARPLH